MRIAHSLLLVLGILCANQYEANAYDPIALGLNISQGMATFQDLKTVNGGTISVLSLSHSHTLALTVIFREHFEHSRFDQQNKKQPRNRGRMVEMYSTIIRYFIEKILKYHYWMR